MKILALDPGTNETAWITKEDTFVFGHASNEEVLKTVKEGDYDLLAVEMIASYGMAVGKEVFETCVWIGRFFEAASILSKKIELIPRIQVKINLCHTTRAKDANVRQALLDRYGEQGSKKNQGATYGISKHVWAALGVYAYAEDHFLNTKP
jgi:hypothetical protein